MGKHLTQIVVVVVVIAIVVAHHGGISTVAHASPTELLPSPWTFTILNGSSEKYATLPVALLQTKQSITLTYNLHGTCLLNGDASAVIFDQNGWKYTSLADYGKNCFDGAQTITIPLSSFTGLSVSTPLTGSFHIRFWKSGGPYTVDVTSVILNDIPVTSPPPPAPVPPPAGTPKSWPLQSVDLMKSTKDAVCNLPSDAFISSAINKALELGANYVAISTPYENPGCGDSLALTVRWINAARAKGLKIWHRHMPLAFEGIYNTPKARSADGTRFLKTIADWIIANKSLIQPGDVFTPIPEPQNGGINGVSYCASSFCQFANAADFNEWLRETQLTAKLALQAAGIPNVKVGYYGFDGFIAWGYNNPDWKGKSFIEPQTVVAMDNVIAIDHYPQSGSQMAADLDGARAVWPNADFVIGEWGTTNATTSDIEQQTRDAFTAFASRTWIKGVNYWHLGPGGSEALVNNDFTNRLQFDDVQSFYK